jgi:hypothetical protein
MVWRFFGEPVSESCKGRGKERGEGGGGVKRGRAEGGLREREKAGEAGQGERKWVRGKRAG